MDHVNPWVDAAEMMRLAEALLAPPLAPPRAPEDAGFGGEFVGYVSPAITLESHLLEFPSSQQHSSNDPILTPDVIGHSPVATIQSEAKMFTDPLPSAVPPAHSPSSFEKNLAPPHLYGSNTDQAIPVHPWPSSSSPVPITPPVPIANPIPATPAPAPTLERLVHFRAIMQQHFGTKGLFILDKDGNAIFDDADHGKLYFMARSLALASKNQQDDIGNVHVRVGSTTTLVVIPAETLLGKIVLGFLVDHAIPRQALPHIVRALHSAISPTQAR
jgi:hypothetical protein